MDRNIIINGNCLDEMKAIPSNSIDLIFADPPYYMRTTGKLLRPNGTVFQGCNDDWDKFETMEEYKKFTYQWLNACYRIVKQNGSIWVIGGMQCIYTIGYIMQEVGFYLINNIVWQKNNPTPNFMGTRLCNSHETLLWTVKNKNTKFTFHYHLAKELNTDTVKEQDYKNGVRKQMGTVWQFSVCSGKERLKDENGKKLHSTQKPQKLLERIILISSCKGDTILDPFGGTMTTAAAAKKLGRNYIMIEQNKKYCHFGEKRLSQISCEEDIDRCKRK